MGLSLRLFPIDHLRGTFGYSHTILELGDLDWEIGDEIKRCARRLPDGLDITSYLGGRIRDGHAAGERYYGKLVEDGYGEPYCWITARELLRFLKEHWAGHPITAYVRAMPIDGLIVLDWH